MDTPGHPGANAVCLNWWPFRLCDGGRAVETIGADRALLAESPFLDERMDLTGVQRRQVPVSAFIDEAYQRPARPASYIFHTSFCGSTLLARLLDRDGVNLSLKEPHVLAQFAQAKRGAELPARARIPDGNLRKAFEGLANAIEAGGPAGETILVKPSNVANNLIPDLLARGGRALFLYSPLGDFLRSMVKRGEESRVYLRGLGAMLAADGESPFPPNPRAALALTDLRLGALIWARQMELFRHFLRESEATQTASLDYLALVSAPSSVTRRVARFLWPDRGSADVSDAVAAEILRRDSKSGGDRTSLAQAEQLEPHDEGVVQDVLAWFSDASPVEPPARVLPRALEESR